MLIQCHVGMTPYYPLYNLNQHFASFKHGPQNVLDNSYRLKILGDHDCHPSISDIVNQEIRLIGTS